MRFGWSWRGIGGSTADGSFVMGDWNEADSSTFRDIASVAVPRRVEMIASVIAAVPFAAGARIKIVELGAGEGRLAGALLTCWPEATLIALEGSGSMRATAAARTGRFGSRITIRP